MTSIIIISATTIYFNSTHLICRENLPIRANNAAEALWLWKCLFASSNKISEFYKICLTTSKNLLRFYSIPCLSLSQPCHLLWNESNNQNIQVLRTVSLAFQYSVMVLKNKSLDNEEKFRDFLTSIL